MDYKGKCHGYFQVFQKEVPLKILQPFFPKPTVLETLDQRWQSHKMSGAWTSGSSLGGETTSNLKHPFALYTKEK